MGVNYDLSGKNIYLDANIFIYMLEGYANYVPVLTQLFDLMDNNRLLGFTSELSLAETLVKPMADGNLTLQEAYKKVIRNSSSLQVFPISREILIAAAKLRTNVVRLPDAIHAATAQASGCKSFLTNDKQLKNLPNLEVILLSAIKDNKLIIN